MNQSIIEAVKELLRVIVLSIIPILIVSLESGKLDLKLIGVTVAVAVLRALDKWLHEKDVKTPLDLKGLDVLKK